jgi:hypothetical protein
MKFANIFGKYETIYATFSASEADSEVGLFYENIQGLKMSFY